MGLLLMRDYSRGVVLGEKTNYGQEKKEDSDQEMQTGSTYYQLTVTPTVTEVVTTTPSPTEAPMTQVTPTAEVTVTPTVETTAEPTATATQAPIQQQTQTTTSVTTTTTTTTSPSAGETVRTILKQIGLPVTTKPTPTPEPEKITVEEDAINERSAAEILQELETIVGSGTQRGVRLRFRTTATGVGLTAEAKAGQAIPLSEAEVERISQALRLGSGLLIDKGDRTELVFSRGEVRARTELPLLMDLETNTLTVETSLGIKSVAVLPDTATAKVIAEGALVTVGAGPVDLVERDDGKIAYRITGQVARKLLGFFSMKSDQTVDVSAESGRVLPNLTDSLGATLFNLVAPQVQ